MFMLYFYFCLIIYRLFCFYRLFSCYWQPVFKNKLSSTVQVLICLFQHVNARNLLQAPVFYNTETCDNKYTGVLATTCIVKAKGKETDSKIKLKRPPHNIPNCIGLSGLGNNIGLGNTMSLSAIGGFLTGRGGFIGRLFSDWLIMFGVFFASSETSVFWLANIGDRLVSLTGDSRDGDVAVGDGQDMFWLVLSATEDNLVG